MSTQRKSLLVIFLVLISISLLGCAADKSNSKNTTASNKTIEKSNEKTEVESEPKTKELTDENIKELQKDPKKLTEEFDLNMFNSFKSNGEDTVSIKNMYKINKLRTLNFQDKGEDVYIAQTAYAIKDMIKKDGKMLKTYIYKEEKVSDDTIKLYTKYCQEGKDLNSLSVLVKQDGLWYLKESKYLN